MATHWIVKTEPSTYSYDDLARQNTAVWDGVKNNLALKHLRQMKPGDRVLVYHTGDEKAVVGIAEVTSEPIRTPSRRIPSWRWSTFGQWRDCRGPSRSPRLRRTGRSPTWRWCAWGVSR